MMAEIRTINTRTERLEETLVTPIEISRKKAKVSHQESYAELPALTVELEKLEREYEIKHVDVKVSKKTNFTKHLRSGQHRYVKQEILEENGFVLYDDELGILECMTCKLGGNSWSISEIHSSKKVLDHKYSDKHRHALVVAKSRIKYHPEAVDGYQYLTREEPVYPFQARKTANIQTLIKKIQPMDQQRVQAVMDAMVFCFLQTMHLRGGRSEAFQDNYSMYYSENRECGSRVGSLQALMIFLDEKVKATRLFKNVNVGHYTSHWSLQQFSCLMHDDITDDIDTDMASGGGNGEIAMVSSHRVMSQGTKGNFGR